MSASSYALIVINATCQVQSSFIEAGENEGIKRILRSGESRLLPKLEAAALALMGDRDRRCKLDDGRVVRLLPLIGSGDLMYALIVEADHNEDYIARAARRYQLTNRQTEVLLLALDGASAGEVARSLQISEYTAQGYIKTLLMKTASHNRAAMVAKVLEWPARQSIAGQAKAVER
jgi:DNA-binding CsgD family transcriptional regulator